MSNTVVAIRGIVQMCFVGFSIQIEWAESVALFTTAGPVQHTEFVSLVEERMQE